MLDASLVRIAHVPEPRRRLRSQGLWLPLGVCTFASPLPCPFNAEPDDAESPYNLVHDPRNDPRVAREPDCARRHRCSAPIYL
jgi:hypothetical protein